MPKDYTNVSGFYYPVGVKIIGVKLMFVNSVV